MKKKVFKKSLLVIALSLSLVNTTWASANQTKVSQKGVGSVMKDAISPRGMYIALGMLEISNDGNGYIGILIQTLCHQDVDKIKQRVYLDKYNESTGGWKQVATYDFSYLSEDYGGSLSAPYESFRVRGEIGGIYRLRGMHNVWANGKSESFSTETDGLEITR